MRIILFSHTGLTTGGAEQCLIEYVTILNDRGHTCEVIIPQEGPMQSLLQERGIQCKVIGYGWGIRPFKEVDERELSISTGNSLSKVFQEVELFNPDVIVVNTAVLPWGLYAGRIFAIPTVLLVHEILSDKDPSLNPLPSYKAYLEMLDTMTDVIVYNSEFVKTEFKEFITRPKTPEKILYPLPPLDRAKIEDLYKENKVRDKLLVAVFGAIAPRKNQLEALRAAKILLDRGITNFSIDLYGDIAANLPYVSRLKKYIRENNLSGYVHLKGYTNNVYETMNKYNVILSTSTYEPFGRTIIEGQLLGRVVITNNTGGGLELVENGKTGFIYQLGDVDELAKRIEWIITHKSEALKVGRVSQEKQIDTFLTNSRYDPLIQAVEILSKKAKLVHDDLFNPIRALYDYNQKVVAQYEHIDKLLHNKITRRVRRLGSRAKNKTKRMVKDIIALTKK
jgi:glycosyltransferase involved in cell wall biosynthesis